MALTRSWRFSFYFTLCLRHTIGLGHVTSSGPQFLPLWNKVHGLDFYRDPFDFDILSPNTIYYVLKSIYNNISCVCYLSRHICIYLWIHMYIFNMFLYVSLCQKSIWIKFLWPFSFRSKVRLFMLQENFLFAHSSQSTARYFYKWSMMMFCYEMLFDIRQPQSNEFQIYFSLL